MRDAIEIGHGSGGEGGIRTHEHLAMLLDFQSSAFDRSATSPFKYLRANDSRPAPPPPASQAAGAVGRGMA